MASSDTSLGGLQRLIDGMHHFCSLSGLVISIAKMEVVIFHGSDSQGSWSLQGNVFAMAAVIKYLGLVFHESGELAPMLRQLHSACQGARAKFQANLCWKGCSTSLPMLLRVFSTLFVPAICYGCEVWGYNFMAILVLMPKSCKERKLPFCAMSVVACLLAILQLPVLLSC